MTKPNHRAATQSDRSRELRRFHAASDPKAIIYGYLDGSIDSKSAQSRLERSTIKGVLLAGELAIQEAHRASNDTEVLQALENALIMFKKVQTVGQLSGQAAVSSSMAKAKVQNSHLPIHAHLLLEGKLPPKEVAERAYQQTVEIGQELSKEHCSARNTTNMVARSNMLGIASELAVLSLLERTALLDMGSETWFPVPANLSDDRRNRPGSSLNHGWDISVFAHRDTTPEIDYRIQVKSSFNPMRLPPENAEGISLVCVDPDLRVSDSEHYIASRVIEECAQELTGPSNFQSVSEHLDRRTAALLDIIDN